MLLLLSNTTSSNTTSLNSELITISIMIGYIVVIIKCYLYYSNSILVCYYSHTYNIIFIRIITYIMFVIVYKTRMTCVSRGASPPPFRSIFDPFFGGEDRRLKVVDLFDLRLRRSKMEGSSIFGVEERKSEDYSKMGVLLSTDGMGTPDPQPQTFNQNLKCLNV